MTYHLLRVLVSIPVLSHWRCLKIHAERLSILIFELFTFSFFYGLRRRAQMSPELGRPRPGLRSNGLVLNLLTSNPLSMHCCERAFRPCMARLRTGPVAPAAECEDSAMFVYRKAACTLPIHDGPIDFICHLSPRISNR
jgi:hypothetical protein